MGTVLEYVQAVLPACMTFGPLFLVMEGRGCEADANPPLPRRHHDLRCADDTVVRDQESEESD